MQTVTHYELGKTIGAGAMGDVFKARDTRTNAAVAMKRLKSGLVARDPAVLQRFIREGEALRQLDHPNIVKMLDTFSDGDAHYIVMEYIEGGDLHAYLAERAPLPANEALTIAIQLADALTRSHFLGIIHRDIKPANILMAAERTPKLTDFGIAHFMEAQESPTQTGMVIGTYAYLSPEACMGMPLDARSDIWAFGVVLYEMLTGQRPFTAEAAGRLVIEIMQNPFPDPQELNPAIPDDLNDLIYRILTKQREARIPSIRLVGAEIEALLGGFDLPATGSRSAVAPVQTEMMFATPTSSHIALHNLPHQATPFVGRKTELTELQRLIDDDGVRLVTLHGPGGMGKSRLAIEAGHTRQEAFSDGVYFVELAPLSDAATIPAAIAEAAGFRFEGSAPPADQVMGFLGNKDMLLILDNFEHIMAGRDLITEILKAAPGVMIVVTSRERLKLTGETVFTLGGMDFPAWETPEDALSYSAVQLFMQAAKRARLDFELDEGNLDYLARICRLVQGTPLGIILAAGWVDTLPLDEIAEEVAASIDFLETELTDLPERQRSIRAAFEYSWRLLTDDERDAFSRLSVFRGSCTHRAAKEVTGAGLRMLTRLANKSLLGRNPATGRFEIHELLRQIGAEHLTDAEAIRQAHAEHYLTLIAQREGDLKGGAQLDTLNALEPDFENIKVAWGWAHTRDLISLMRHAVEPMLLAFNFRNRENEVLPLLRATHDKYEDATDAEAQYLWATTFLLMARHTRKKASDDLERLQKARAISEKTGDARLKIIVQTGFMADTQTSGDVETALTHAQKGLAIAEEAGELYWQSEIYYFLGFLLVRAGQIEHAFANTQRANAIQKQAGNLFGQAVTANNLGTIKGFTRDFEAAGTYYKQAHAIATKIGNLQSSMVTACNLAFHNVREGDLDTARRYIQDAQAIKKRLNAKGANSDYLFIPILSLALRQRDYEQVRALATPAINRTEPMQAQFKVAILTILTSAEYALGNHERAKELIRQTYDLTMPNNPYQQGGILRALIPFAVASGDAVRATQLISLHYEHVQMASETKEFNPIVLDLRATLKEELGEEAYEAAWQQGKTLDVIAESQQAMRDYLDDPPPDLKGTDS